MKSILIKTINWTAKFERTDGSYYDKVAEIYAPTETKEKDIRKELSSKGWTEVETNSGIVVFEKERYVIRVFRIWG